MDAASLAREDLFIATVGQHYPGLVRRLTAVIRDREAALDLAQEAYLRAYRAWDGFDGTDARAWLHTIGLRLAFNERDRRRRWNGLTGRSTDPEPWVAPEDRGLDEALRGLRREHRATLLLNAVDGYTQATTLDGRIVLRRRGESEGPFLDRRVAVAERRRRIIGA